MHSQRAPVTRYFWRRYFSSAAPRDSIAQSPLIFALFDDPSAAKARHCVSMVGDYFEHGAGSAFRSSLFSFPDSGKYDLPGKE